jgi:hypothetical protein
MTSQNTFVIESLRNHLTSVGYAEATITQRCARLAALKVPIAQATQA